MEQDPRVTEDFVTELFEDNDFECSLAVHMVDTVYGATADHCAVETKDFVFSVHDEGQSLCVHLSKRQVAELAGQLMGRLLEDRV